MARRNIVQLVDDLDGGSAEETVAFALDGRIYEIDLSAPNAAELRETLAPYVTAGRRTATRSHVGARPRIPRQTLPGDDPSQIRAWALAHGYEVSARGRIPSHVREAYQSR